MNDPHPLNAPRLRWWQVLGPGFVVAATGVGAGDLIAAGVAGARYGLVALWAVALGAVFKWVLNEGVSRWQLATGTTMIEGWVTRMPRLVAWYFLGYLVLWSFLVAAALSSACGVAAHAMAPALSIKAWGALHAIVGFVLVWRGNYALFERVMKALVAAMFVVVIICALLLRPDFGEFARGLLVPRIPEGSGRFLLGVIGGVGGSVTLLCYGYWIREKGWRGAGFHRRSLLDLFSAYALSGLFGIGMIVIAAETGPGAATGNALVIALGERLHELVGPIGRWCFLVGFWCAVFTSLLGVWQGVPYLFSDTLTAMRNRGRSASPSIESAHNQPGAASRRPSYRWYLVYLAFPPLLLLLFDRPILVVVIYSIAGAFFMPFLAALLLVMNNRVAWTRELRNPWPVNLLLVLSLVLFGWLFASESIEILTKPGDS